MLHVCWSRPTTEPVTSTEYMAVIKSLHCLPPPPSVFLLLAIYMWWGVWGTEWGVKRVCSVDEADCVCVSEAVVLAEEEREAVSLRIQPARFASSRLPGSLKLFDDRTGQHHHRWWWGGGICWCCCWWWGGMEACHLYTAVSFILSSSPPPPPARLSLPLLCPLVFLCCCCFAPFLRPLQAL